MKQTAVFVIVLLCVVSCGTGRDGREAMTEADSLRQVIVEQDSLLNTLFSSLDTIMSNLQVMRTRENIVTTAVNNPGSGLDQKSLTEDIAHMDTMLVENKRVIAGLRRNVDDLKRVNIRVGALEQIIRQLTSQANASGEQAQKLRHELEDRTNQMRSLSGEVAGLEQRNEQLTTQVRVSDGLLNEAYYLSERQSVLLRDKIVYRTSIIGRSLRINEDRNLDQFIKIDIRTFDHLQIDGANPMLISSHPEGSYRFARDNSGVLWLNILDYRKFWEFTKVLVVSYK